MSKFIPWVSDGNVVENTNVYNYENFSGINSQSKEGFQSGNIISSTYMNSALRQANLVIAALMECTGNNTLDLTSSVTDVKSALQTYFSGLYVARATSDSDGTNIKANYAKQNGTYNNMTVGNATNATNATNAVNSTNATNATYAQYASSDTTKGTIEERLTNLGFKHGSVSLEQGLTAGINTLSREGNYVKGRLTFYQITPITSNSTLTKIGVVPQEFIPKLYMEQPYMILASCSVIEDSNGSRPIRHYGALHVLLYPSGDLYICLKISGMGDDFSQSILDSFEVIDLSGPKYAKHTDYGIHSPSSARILDFDLIFGYEAEPITS